MASPTAALGVPPLAAGLVGGAWLLALLLWAGGAVGGSFAVFLAALLSAAVATGWLAAAAGRAKGISGLAAGLVVALAAGVPVVFDPHTGDVFNVPRYTLVVIGGLVLAGTWAVAAVHDRNGGPWRNGLQWPIAAVVLWTAVSAFSGVSIHVGLLGDYGSYDGLYAMLGFGVLAMTAAGVLKGGDVRKVLAALAFAGGGVVVLYGLIQLHDTETSGAPWDFINWRSGSFAHEIFSTFGNPNHLAGYLAVILPAVLVMGLGAKRWQWRIASGLFALAILLEILRATARGAWVAVIATAVVLAVSLAPELRRRPKLTGAGIGVLLVAVAGGMAAFGHRFLQQPLSSLFQSGGSTPVEQRFQMWRIAADLAVHRPLTGVGPDSYALVFQQHQSASWVAALGPNYVAEGAHDLFMNVLADQGFVGLALFVALLLLASLRSIGAWRRLRSLERQPGAEEAAVAGARHDRLTLAMVCGGLTAYLVQAVFNVQQVGLSFAFWLLLGLLALVSRSAGVPDTLRPRVLVSAGAGAPAAAEAAEEAEARPVPARGGARRGGRAPSLPWPTLLAGAVAAVIVVLLSIGADGPYRADHAYWAANADAQAAATATGAEASQLSQAYLAAMKTAISLNPWEAQYPAVEAASFVSSAAHAGTSAAVLSDLTQARALDAKARADQPLAGSYAAAAATVDVDLARTASATKASYLADAVNAARQALRDNPLDTAYQQLLATMQADQRTGATNA